MIKPEMVGGNNRSFKGKGLIEIESLPDEVLFDVLVRLQAQDIYDSARFICSKWYHMIHTRTFIDAHFQHTTYGLLFRSMSRGDSVFMAVGESGRVEITKIRYNKLRLRWPVPTSCNGLVLEFQKRSNYNLYISNPTTRQIIALPPLVGYTTNRHLFGIAYAAASMEYKAFILVPVEGTKKTCCILTIGVDNSWRTVGEIRGELFKIPLITEGFVHWVNMATYEVFTMNVETEIITETSGPTPKGKGNEWNTYLSTGRYLSLLRLCGEFCWEVWEMKPKIDYQWRKVCDISLEAHKSSLIQRFGFKQYDVLIPIGWLKYLELLVLCIRYSDAPQIYVYNLLTQELVTIELPARHFDYKIVVHKNSLVSLGGC